MEIRIRNTGQVMFWNEFRDLLLSQNPSELITVAPQTAEWLDAHGADVVLEGPQATGGTHYQFSQRSGVEQVDGKWFTKYVLGPVFTDNEGSSAAEQEAAYKAMKDAEQAKIVRDARNRKLSETDWRFRSDMTPSQAWVDYCVALRNVPEQAGFPWSVDWPVEP